MARWATWRPSGGVCGAPILAASCRNAARSCSWAPRIPPRRLPNSLRLQVCALLGVVLNMVLFVVLLAAGLAMLVWMIRALQRSWGN